VVVAKGELKDSSTMGADSCLRFTAATFADNSAIILTMVIAERFLNNKQFQDKSLKVLTWWLILKEENNDRAVVKVIRFYYLLY
jgi:hypothetical protein